MHAYRYVFHEVRVPLNSARQYLSFIIEVYIFIFSVVLAAQSMEASKTLSKSLEVEFDALMGSLTMMSQGKYSIFFDVVNRPTIFLFFF